MSVDEATRTAPRPAPTRDRASGPARSGQRKGLVLAICCMSLLIVSVAALTPVAHDVGLVTTSGWAGATATSVRSLFDGQPSADRGQG